MVVSTNSSIQESLYPELTCFGCGHANPHGFHLRSWRVREGRRACARGVITQGAQLPGTGTRGGSLRGKAFMMSLPSAAVRPGG
jgi:hypothetical protein